MHLLSHRAGLKNDRKSTVDSALCPRAFAVVAGLFLFGWVGASSLMGENWPHWRGPALDGSSTETGLPTTWNTSNNVAWSTAMPGPSAATPCVWGDSIFVTSPDAQKDLQLLCVDRKTGDVRWQKQVSTGNSVVNLNNMASPTPVTDGKTVFVLFGTGDMAAFDFSGKELWKRNLSRDYGKFALMYIYGASPLLFKDKLYIAVIQRDTPNEYAHARDDKPTRDSYLLCLNAKTGETLWRQVRATDATKETMESYASPIPYKGPKGWEILVVGGDYITGHDAETGVERWRTAGFNPRQTDFQKDWMRVVTTPVHGDGLIFACGPKGQPVFAVRDGGTGAVTESHRAWVNTNLTSDWSTPLFYQHRLYVMNGAKKTLACLDPKTGEIKWTGSLGVKEQLWSSPTGADGKIYCVSEKGNVVVCAAGDDFKVLSVNPLDDSLTKASAAVSNGQIFIRTTKFLYCVGKGN